MGGGSKKEMKQQADDHFGALQQIIPTVGRLMLFDYDDRDKAFHPDQHNPALAEWKRKNIENYLLIPDAWKRAALKQMGSLADDLFAQPVLEVIEQFFSDQNLTLPFGRNWRQVSADIFSAVNGKRILFENDKSLFQLLRAGGPATTLVREQVALNMTADEIHEDVHGFFDRIKALTTGS